MKLGTIPEGKTPREDQLERDEEFEGRRAIIVAIDHGPTSLNALSFALDHVITHHDRLHVVHVLPHDAAGDHKSIMRAATQILFDKLSKLAFSRGRQHVSFAMKFGEVGKELCNEATRIKAVFIVMGNRGSGRMKTFLSGSNTEHCLHHASTPLVVVPNGYVPPDGPILGTQS